MKQIIYCPVCHQRFFDTSPSSHGWIEIRCPRCRQLQHIALYLPDHSEKSNQKNTT